MPKPKGCKETSPHGTSCNLSPNHNGRHYSIESNCVWLGDGYHHDFQHIHTASPVARTRPKRGILRLLLSRRAT